MKLTKKELKNIVGGASISATFLNYVIKGFNTFIDIGRYLGSSIRRISNNSYCSTK